MRPRSLVVVALAAVLFGLVACTSSGSSGAEPVATTEVRAVKSYRFSPADIAVATGAEVTWSNEDNFVHNVHLLDGSDTTRDLAIGGSTTIRFDEPGLVRFECSLHPAQMTGTVLVE